LLSSSLISLALPPCLLLIFFVTEVQVVYGEFDVVARIELGDVTLMDETVTMARKLPGVTRTSTLISSGIQS